jgi:hypothetical protein
MKNLELLSALETRFAGFEAVASTFDSVDFFRQPQAEKWSVAQHVLHLINSVKGIAGALKDTTTLQQFGRAERPSRTYEAMAIFYTESLAARQAKGMPYNHLDTGNISKTELLGQFMAINIKLLERIAPISESDLDTLQLPHPLLGILTLREMLYFTAVHTEHHRLGIELLNK